MDWLTQPIPPDQQPIFGIVLAVFFIAITWGLVGLGTPKPRTFASITKNYLTRWGVILGIIVVVAMIGTAWSALNWHGWISEGLVDTSRCTTVTQLPSNTWEKYFKSFTCQNSLYSSQCVHVDWNGSSCEEFTPDW